MNKNRHHVSVLIKEVLDFLKIKKSGIYFDGTLGGGGHALAILKQCQKSYIRCQIVGVDLDEEAIEYAKKRLENYKKSMIFVKGNFRDIDLILAKKGIKKINGALLDLGVSSIQLDQSKRGFTFKEEVEAPLDMRMNKSQEFNAADILNQYSKELLVKIFFEYGEERFSRKIAKKIVEKRREKPIQTNKDLLEILRETIPNKIRKKRRRHFATNIFRALRMEVNHELESLQGFLPKVVEPLDKKGRIVIISFHSLEDRIVKHFFKNKEKTGQLKILTKKPIIASEEEIKKNPRSRSAKLRAAEII